MKRTIEHPTIATHQSTLQLLPGNTTNVASPAMSLLHSNNDSPIYSMTTTDNTSHLQSEMQVSQDLELLLAMLPDSVRMELANSTRLPNLIEIILDLGRLPEARYSEGEEMLGDTEITEEHLRQVIAQIGDFGSDNRAGIERTLHRISAMRNRKGQVIGLTCRVGRAEIGRASCRERV